MKTKFYARIGTKLEVYFCAAPWKEISPWKYYFEKFIMFNKCLKKEKVN